MPKMQPQNWEAEKAKHDETGVCVLSVDVTTFTGPIVGKCKYCGKVYSA